MIDPQVFEQEVDRRDSMTRPMEEEKDWLGPVLITTLAVYAVVALGIWLIFVITK